MFLLVLHAHFLSASVMLGQARGEAPKSRGHDEKACVIFMGQKYCLGVVVA